jgi:hypothetical protein
MKHIKLYEEFVNEKAYQMTGSYGAKGIAGKLLFAFKKEVERVQYDGNVESTLEDINKAWSKWADSTGAKIVEAEVIKQVKDKESIVYLIATLGGYKWVADEVNGINAPGKPELLVRFPGDFVINTGFADDVDGNKFTRKLEGGLNTAIVNTKLDTTIIGDFDPAIGHNNVEIRAALLLTIDAK